MRDEKAWDWLNHNELSYDIWNQKYRNRNESFEDWLTRVSGGNQKIKRLIYEKKFLFGGRTLSNRGTSKGSFSNCYSRGFVPDSLDCIMDVAKDLALTFKAQGGQGLSLSKIRPKGSLIHGEFESDGIVPFMEIFNTVTASVSQGNSRKGALLMSLDINHLEAETFMTIKSDLKKINKANLSMEIDDEFMKSLSTNELNQKKFKLLAQQACKYAEPGVLFTNRLRNYNMMEFVDDYQIETTNPCGEQPLPKHGACNLSSINLSEYVVNPFTNEAYFDLETLGTDMEIIVEAMDDVLEENIDNHALLEQRECARKWRNIGIGIMGLHDVFIKMGLIYGSDKSIHLTKNIMGYMFQKALRTSIKLGKERGNFPGYSSKVWDASILQMMFTDDEIQEFREQNYLRNSTLLSIAPTGTLSNLLNVSSGCEPFFNIKYQRKTVSLTEQETIYNIDVPVIEDARNKNWHLETFVTANDISWKAHVDIQAACQQYVDASISKTCNLPSTTTPEEIEQLYLYAWKQGLKGCTIYVDGSRDPILSTSSTSNQKSLESQENDLKMDFIVPATRADLGEVLNGSTFKYKTACGTLYITVNKDQNGNIVEIFTNSSKNGTCKANLNGETRMASLALRAGVKVEEVIDQLKGIHCQSCAFARAKGNAVDGTSCPDIIAKCILSSYKSNEKKAYISPVTKVELREVCPECGQPLRHEGGCVVCSCGFSRCG